MTQDPIDRKANGTNGTFAPRTLHRAEELEDLIDAVKSLIIPHVKAADEAAAAKSSGRPPLDAKGQPHNVLVEHHRPEDLIERLRFSLPSNEGRGRDGLLNTIQTVLKYSVNTWDQGFLDKLYASTNPVSPAKVARQRASSLTYGMQVGVISELLLAVLNTNVHVYQVSPALTIIEKTTARTLASLFGLNGPRAGGVTCQGGSSSNLTSVVIARNTLHPSSKTSGNGDSQLVMFTSVHGHYSLEKAAVICGIGAHNVISVPVDDQGRMIPSALRELVVQAKAEGKKPFYVNATAGTTVLGSFDPFRAISAVCKEFGLWLHIDASWGGAAIFSAAQKYKLDGSELADSLTMNPHKMLNVPVTCSFLLTNDVAVFHRANTITAGYLFHSAEDEEIWDLADLTLQCGRKADSLKLALSWIYYGPAGFEKHVDHGFEMAARLASLIADSPDVELVSTNPPPCLQVCFYYAPDGKLAPSKEENTKRTREMVEKLVGRGFMVDYAPGKRGSFFRVVVNCQTLPETVEGLFEALGEVGKEVIAV